MAHVELQQAKQQLDKLIQLAAQGEVIVITEHNQPLAQLTAVGFQSRRHFGSAKGLIEMTDDFDEPLVDFREYM